MTDPPPLEDTAQLVAEVVVPDLERTVAFLVALGFHIERNAGTFAVLRWDDSLLFIAEDAKALVENRWVNVRVMVPDVNAKWNEVMRMGARIVVPVGDRDYGLRDFIVAVPGGMEVRFAQVLP